MSIGELERTVERLRRECDEARQQIPTPMSCGHPSNMMDLRFKGVCLVCQFIMERDEALHRAEAVVEAVRSWGICCGLCGLAYSRVQMALAAWEEGKHP